MSSRSKPTKKIKVVLAACGIKNVVNGYFTKIPSDDLRERVAGICQAAYTGWNSKGQVVCVLVKPRKGEWRLKTKT